MVRFSLSRVFCLVVGSLALVMGPLGGSARASLIVYDPFNTGAGPGDYLAGDDSTGINVLGGQNPTPSPTGTFYAGGWIQSGGDAQAVFDVGSLSYPLFPQSGGLVTDSVQFSCCSFGRDGREINGGLEGASGLDGVIYQSFLIDFGTQGTDDPTQFGKRGYEMWNGGVGDAFLAVDLFVNHFGGINEFTLALTTPSGTETELVGGGLTLDELAGVHLIVLRFEFERLLPDTVSLYLDPTDSIEGNYIPAASVSAPNSDLAITHHGVSTNFTFSGGGHIPARFDELRWGDTFADVTPFLSNPVPAPPTLGLFLLSILGVLTHRRGRR